MSSDQTDARPPIHPPTKVVSSDSLTGRSTRGGYVRASEVPLEILESYGLAGAHQERLGLGHINETFIVQGDRSADKVLVQAINHDVFVDPEAVMANLDLVLETLGQSAVDAGEWAELELLATDAARTSAVDECGRTWRAFRFIGQTTTLTRARHADHARATAYAFGAFQLRLRELEPSRLHETIPRFHDTAHRFQQLESAVDEDPADRAIGCQDLIDAALEQRSLANRILDLIAAGEAPLRVVHNDAKISNVLFDSSATRPICVVDLDTVMPGSALYDFGDMVRSMSHRTEEDEQDLTRIEADPALFAALCEGFLAGTGDLLNAREREHLVDGGLVLVLEQGVRFLADHLLGDVYFRCHRENHNLDRARTQFKLLESLLRQENELRACVR